MRIAPLGQVNGYVGIRDTSGRTQGQTGAAKAADMGKGAADVYIPGNKPAYVTYGKTAADPGGVAIARLKEESEQAYASLRRLIVALLERQGCSAGMLKEAGGEKFAIDEIASAEAAALIADDGPLGPEAVSDRIVDFAVALSGGERARLEELRGAINEGFRQVEEMLGGLPAVSVRTYDLIMEKLDRAFAEP